MKKILILSLCSILLLMSGCFKFTPQAEFEAQQKKAAAVTVSTTATSDESLTLVDVEVKDEVPASSTDVTAK